MNFDLDDPLAGILSDGSDDSFFDDDILGKKKPAKKNSTPTAEKKNALFDLDDNSKTKNNDDLLTKDIFLPPSKTDGTVGNSKTESKIEVTKSPAPTRSKLSKEVSKVQQVDADIKSTGKTNLVRSPARYKSTSSVDKINIIDELSVEPKKDVPVEKGKSSQSLLEDILGEPVTRSNSKRPITAGKKEEFDLDLLLGKSESKTAIEKNVVTKPMVKIEKHKEPSYKKKSTDDWLGVFQEQDETAEDDTDMPSWLGGTKKSKALSKPNTNEINTEKVKEVQHNEESNNDKNNDSKNHQESKFEILNQNQECNNLNLLSATKWPVTNEDVTMEGATLYLQQQESQIMVALQLKAQDEKLAAMQTRQKESQRVQREAALGQREQLDALLQRQAAHRRQLQAVIATHQERITQRIKSLLETANEDQRNEDVPDGDFENAPIKEKDSPYTKEKKQLLQLVQSLQENHDKEIDLMETSYRRQIAFLEISFNQAEERMKEESDKLVKFYQEKITWLDDHHQMHKKLTDDNLNALMERHKEESEMLRQQHLENIKILQEHHSALMENVKNAVKQEHVLIKDSAGFSSELQELIIDARDNKIKCQELVKKIEALTQNTQQNSDRSVQMRESQISEMIQQLKLDRQNFEKEKSENKDLVHMLESRLKQMTSMIEEESTILKQKKIELEFEKATFSKQTEFAKNILKKQDEEMKMLKEDIQKEYQDKVAKIEEEKALTLKNSAIIAKEKASVQSIKAELEKTRAELQIQLDDVTAERSKLIAEKQELHIEEQRMLAKSRDLDLLTKTTIDKQTQAEKKQSEAEIAQHKYEERIRRIQEHVVSLNARERQIAKEKVALSRERLSLHNERKQLESRQQCSLCRNTQYNTTFSLPETYLNPTVSRDYSAMPLHTIEEEMARLMGRTIDRHRPSGQSLYEDRAEEINDVDSALPAQADSGAYKDYMDPKFMMLRFDVQQVISNLDQSKKVNAEPHDEKH